MVYDGTSNAEFYDFPGGMSRMSMLYISRANKYYTLQKIFKLTVTDLKIFNSSFPKSLNIYKMQINDIFVLKTNFVQNSLTEHCEYTEPLFSLFIYTNLPAILFPPKLLLKVLDSYVTQMLLWL